VVMVVGSPLHFYQRSVHRSKSTDLKICVFFLQPLKIGEKPFKVQAIPWTVKEAVSNFLQLSAKYYLYIWHRQQRFARRAYSKRRLIY